MAELINLHSDRIYRCFIGALNARGLKPQAQRLRLEADGDLIVICAKRDGAARASLSFINGMVI